jgi:hypothetical protein
MEGPDYPFYRLIVDRLFKKDIPVHQAVLIGLYLYAAAETSTYVGGQVQVAVAAAGVRRVKPEIVTELLSRVRSFSKLTDDMFLSFADVSLPTATFRERLQLFEAAAIELRNAAMQTEAERAAEDFGDTPNPFPMLPAGIAITKFWKTGKVVFEEPPYKLVDPESGRPIHTEPTEE